MSPSRRPTHQKPVLPSDSDRSAADPFSSEKPVVQPKRVGWNGGRELPPVPLLLSPEQEVGAEIAVRAGTNVAGKAADVAKGAIRGALGKDELPPGPATAGAQERDVFGGPARPDAGDPRQDQGRRPGNGPGAQGRMSRLRARGRGLVGALAPFTVAEGPAVGSPGSAGAAGGLAKRGARAMARRAGSAALGSIPTVGRVRMSGHGSIMMGLRLLANRNPLYRFFLSRLPVRGKVQTAIAAGCGCTSGCGCCSSCCSCAGCFWPVILIFIVIGMSGVWASRQPGFVAPLFCERTAAAFCSSDSTSLTMSIDDLPPGSIEDYQVVETETGVPWFYLAAWEKVASDFGRADYSTLSGSVAVPGTALEATYTHLAQTTDAILSPDGNTPDQADAVQLHEEAQQAIDDQEALIKRLTSPLRGGSFGLMLMTSAEYAQYGQKDDGTWRDPWDRKEASEIIAHHLVDIYQGIPPLTGLAATGTPPGTLTYDGTPDIGLLDQLTEDWIHSQLIAISQDPKRSADYDRFLAVVGEAPTTPTCTTFEGHRTCTHPSPGATITPTDTWWDGPHANLPITLPERFYVCQSVSTEADVSAGACDSYLAGANTLTVDPKQTLSDIVALYYDPKDSFVPGTAVSDWGKLQILFGALLSSDPAWGADQTAYYLAPQITPDGRTGAQERINSYAQAIVRYGRSAYESWATAQLAAHNDTGAGRAQAAAYAFWNPPALAVAKESGIPREFLLATLEADGAFGCLPGQGVSVPDTATTDWMDPGAVSMGKAMGKAMGFTGNAWIAMAAQMQWENGGNPRGNNPLNMIDDNGHDGGFFTYAAGGQIGWWYGGSAIEHHWFAVFDTIEHGAAAGSNLYLGGLHDQNDWRGYTAIVNAGRSGDALATARAIEASLADSQHYGANDIVPGTGHLWKPDQPQHDGRLVKSVFGVQVASIGGCWRFGAGNADAWAPPTPTAGQPAIPANAIAMNYCLVTLAASPGGCGTATLTVGGKSVTLPVAGFWDGSVGNPDETIAGLSPGATSELGLSGAGPWPLSIALNKPDTATWPSEVYGYATPLDAVRALAAELGTLSGVASPKVPTLGQMAPAWRTHSACVIDRTQATVQVPDPWTGGVTYAVSPWCRYLDDVIRYINVFVGGASGGEIKTIFGVQPISRFGYIWPIQNVFISSGFEPRGFGTNIYVSFNGNNHVGIHTGLDLVPPGGHGEVIADKAGWLYIKAVTAVAVVSGVNGGRPFEYQAYEIFIDHSDGLTGVMVHVTNKLDPTLAAALASSTITKHGQRAVWVQQGQILASLDDVARHTHYQIDIYKAGLPYSYPYAGDPQARFFEQWSTMNFLVIDPLAVLPWDPSMLNSYGSHKLPSWYYTVYGPSGRPPAFDPTKVP